MVHFGLKRSMLVLLGPPTVLWPLLKTCCGDCRRDCPPELLWRLLARRPGKLGVLGIVGGTAVETGRGTAHALRLREAALFPAVSAAVPPALRPSPRPQQSPRQAPQQFRGIPARGSCRWSGGMATLAEGSSELQTRFYRTFRVETFPFQATLLKLSLFPITIPFEIITLQIKNIKSCNCSGLSVNSESVKCRFSKCRFRAELEKLEKIFRMGGSVEN